MLSRLSPFPKDSLRDKVQALYSPLRVRKCNTVLFLPGGGKRTLLSYYRSHPRYISSILGPIYEHILFVYVDPDKLEENSARGYMTILLQELLKAIRIRQLSIPDLASMSAFDQVLTIAKYILSKGFRIAFFLQDFEVTLLYDETIFFNLEGIMALDKPKITYIFLASKNIVTPDLLPIFHNLKYAITQNIHYIALFSRQEIDYVIDAYGKKLNVRISPSVRRSLVTLTGGHPQLLKYSLYILKESNVHTRLDPDKARNVITKHPQLSIICADIWSSLNEREKHICVDTVRVAKIHEADLPYSDYLLKTRLIVKKRHQSYAISSLLFQHYIASHIPKETLTYDPEGMQLYYGTKLITANFTDQEFRLLTHLIEHKGEVVTRDTIGELLWSTASLEKYSDWMIDKIVSTIRKKVIRIGVTSQKLITVKKRGFYLQ